MVVGIQGRVCNVSRKVPAMTASSFAENLIRNFDITRTRVTDLRDVVSIITVACFCYSFAFLLSSGDETASRR